MQLLGAPLRAVGSVLPGFLQSVPLVNLVAVEWVDVAEVGKAAAHAAHPESDLAGSVDVSIKTVLINLVFIAIITMAHRLIMLFGIPGSS